jgi:arylsulfatase A-like enzyme
MPTIRSMVTAGINLTNYYSISLCTPARSALLTGRVHLVMVEAVRLSCSSGKYPINNGMQHGVITGAKVWGLPSTEVLLPQYLAKLGYSSHLVGKWHLVRKVHRRNCGIICLF